MKITLISFLFIAWNVSIAADSNAKNTQEKAQKEECPEQMAPGSFPFSNSVTIETENPTNKGIVPRGFVALKDGTHVIHGIDASKWQRSVDFVQVRRCQGKFAYIRLSVGDKPDKELEYRDLWESARYAQLYVGPYHTLELSYQTLKNGNFSKLSDSDRQRLLDENIASARKQGEIFLSRLKEVLSLDPIESKHSEQLGLPYLPIALAASLRPDIVGGANEAAAFGNIYAAAICEWIATVRSDPAFSNQAVVLFTTPFIYSDFKLSQGKCSLDKIPVWIAQRSLDGDREFAEKEPRAASAIRELCGESPATSRCVVQQYTSYGGFALSFKKKGLDLDRFYGTESDLKKLLQVARSAR